MTIHVAPELEAGLRDRAKADGVLVEDLVVLAVNQYLRRPAPPAVRRIPMHDRRQEMAWAANPNPAYQGKWVVLEGNTSGVDGIRVVDEARGKGIESPFLIFVPPLEDAHFVAGWLD